MTKIPFSRTMGSACHVVGPFAPFAQDAAIQAVRVPGSNLILGGGRNQNVARMEENLLRGHRLAAGGKFRQRLPLRINPVIQLRNIEAIFVVESAVDIGHADDFVTRRMHQESRLRAHVPESLNDYAAGLALHPQLVDRAVAADHQSAAGGFPAPLRAAQLERFSGDNCRGRLPDVHGIGVHHPGHNLFVCADIGAGISRSGPSQLLSSAV